MSGRMRRRATAAARLYARPGSATGELGTGTYALEVADNRDALLYVPVTYRPARPAPLVLTLHGASGDADSGFYPLRPLADDAGLLLLSPASRAGTWDRIVGQYGPDVAVIDEALAATFNRCAVDPARVAIAGFSDGASYALSLGLGNGDLFRHVLAFSPGFVAPAGVVGTPRIFVSHGTRDMVLPIDGCSRRIVPQLEKAGCEVTYVEFEGGHTAPADIAERALAWFLPELKAPNRG